MRIENAPNHYPLSILHSALLCALLLVAGLCQAADHPVSLSTAQEATLALTAAQRQQPAASVVQEAASVCLAQMGQQAQAQTERTLVERFRQLTPDDQTAVSAEAVKRQPKP